MISGQKWLQFLEDVEAAWPDKKVKSATSVQTPLLSRRSASAIARSLNRGGVAAPSKECCEATVDGADGVVLVNEISGR